MLCLTSRQEDRRCLVAAFPQFLEQSLAGSGRKDGVAWGWYPGHTSQRRLVSIAHVAARVGACTKRGSLMPSGGHHAMLWTLGLHSLPVQPDLGGAGDDTCGCMVPSSLSDKGPSEDPRPEERPVEGEALSTFRFSLPPYPGLLPSPPLARLLPFVSSRHWVWGWVSCRLLELGGGL